MSASVALLMGLAVPGAWAQTDNRITGTLDAAAQGSIPPGANFSVRASSGGGNAAAIADLFRDALENAGYRIGAGPSYELSFQYSGDRPGSGNRTNLELRGERGSSSSGDVELKMRWKTKRDDTTVIRRGHRLSVAIIDADRNPIWNADVELQASDVDDFAMVDAVMPAIIKNLGRSVYALRVP